MAIKSVVAEMHHALGGARIGGVLGRTNLELGREEKRDEVLCAARALFLEHGYEATSIQRLARQVNVAPNTLYWYFKDKDTLLVEVMKRVVAEGLAEHERRSRGSLEAQLRWLFDRFWELRSLVATVHARAQLSPEVRAWHETFHRILEQSVQAELRSRGLAGGHEATAARCISFITEGIVAHQSSKAEQRRIIKWLVFLVEQELAQT
jgi:AcrR family transcriptional regulator